MSQPWSIEVDSGLVDEVRRRHEELGAEFPRIALFLFGGRDADLVAKRLDILKRLSPEAPEF